MTWLNLQFSIRRPIHGAYMTSEISTEPDTASEYESPRTLKLEVPSEPDVLSDHNESEVPAVPDILSQPHVPSESDIPSEPCQQPSCCAYLASSQYIGTDPLTTSLCCINPYDP